MNWKRVLIGVVVVAVLLGGGFVVYRQFFAQPAEEPDTAVTGDVTDAEAQPVSTGFVSAEGQIVPQRSAALAFLVGGEVAEILAPQGTAVTTGAPILRLDTTDQEIALVQAQAGLEQATANLETARVGVAAAETAEKAAQVGVDAANAQLALVSADASDAQVALNEASVALANASINQAAASRDVVLQGPLASQVGGAETQLRAAEAAALAAREALDNLRREENVRDETLAAAELRYNAAQANVAAAQAALAEVQAGATSGQRQAAQGGVSAAVAQRDASQAQLDLLLAGTRAEQIAVAEAGVAQAEAALVEAGLARTQAESAVTQAEAGVAQAEAAVAAAEEALALMTLTAPFDGVVASISVEVGEIASTGLPVVQFGNFDAWQVETTDLTELDVVELEVGSQVEVRVDAIPGEVLEGTITDISQISTLTRGDVTYTVTIELAPNPDLPLRWGMTVFVDVDVDQG